MQFSANSLPASLWADFKAVDGTMGDCGWLLYMYSVQQL